MLPGRCKVCSFIPTDPTAPPPPQKYTPHHHPHPKPLHLSSTLIHRWMPSLLSLNCYVVVPDHRESLQVYCVLTVRVSTWAHVPGSGPLLWKARPALEWPAVCVSVPHLSHPFPESGRNSEPGPYGTATPLTGTVDSKNRNMGYRPT